jgi:high-affinity nickel-transport protein
LSFPDLALVTPALAVGGVGVLATGLVLGFRHGFDWDHIAAITDITSTTATADLGTDLHQAEHTVHPHEHVHPHGGHAEIVAHEGAATAVLPARTLPVTRPRFVAEQRHAILLGTLYAFGHASVVLVLGVMAIAFGALLPDWVDPIMGRVVGFTLLVLGIWVFVSLYQYLRGGAEFKLRSRWMLVFDGVRYSWRRFQAKVHGHEHVAPLEMSSYGARTAFGVGMIHGIGAETGSQALLIAAVGGAAGAGLGIPMLLTFVVGLVAANTVIVVVSATGFVAGQLRQPIYIAIGVLAGIFSIVVGLSFLLGTDSLLPDIQQLFGGGGL